MRDAVKAAAEGAREGFTEASKSRKNQDDIDEEKRADNRDKEKQMNHEKGEDYQEKEKKIATRIGKVISTRQRYEEKKITRG